MGVQKRVYRPVEYDFPPDFAERLELFKQKSGLSWKEIARLLGVSLHRLRQWRKKGAAPQPHPSLHAADHRRSDGTAGRDSDAART